MNQKPLPTGKIRNAVWNLLPIDVQSALWNLAAGRVIRIPKRPPLDLSERITLMHDANIRIYGMTDSESIREISRSLHLPASVVRSKL